MTETCIVAIDPGVSGAVAFFFPAAPERVAVDDMPVVNGEVDPHALRQMLLRYAPTLAVIEVVNAMPSSKAGKDGKRAAMGVQSAFNFGANWAAARTVLALHGAPMHLVLPRTWKLHHRLPGGDEGKEAGRALALRLFPASADRFARKKDHGRADAALMAAWAADCIAAHRAAA